MLQIRRADARGHFNHGWLDTYHTFSFADYHDPAHMGFRPLRVINEDRVLPGQGFGMHAHRDMEILTYILDGALEHRDSLGNGSILRAGEFQRMSAGTGIRHSEFNPSSTRAVHLYQIWLLPERRGIEPSYEQRSFADPQSSGQLRLVASPDGADNSLVLHQDASVYLATLNPGAQVRHELRPDRHAWLQVLRGGVTLERETFAAGDGVAISAEPTVSMSASQPAEILLFDLA
jgi:redox-sensitive bicupin YhaK (pirin superfamily)